MIARGLCNTPAVIANGAIPNAFGIVQCGNLLIFYLVILIPTLIGKRISQVYL